MATETQQTTATVQQPGNNSGNTVAPAGGQQQGLMGAFTPIILMLLAFYFLIIRPQQKREDKRQDLVKSIKKGDKILMASGIIGILHKVVNEKEISLEISENVRIRMLKSAIADVLEKNSKLENEDENNDTPASNNKTIEKSKKVASGKK
jgi:preprotein translocase subunit YajC